MKINLNAVTTKHIPGLFIAGCLAGIAASAPALATPTAPMVWAEQLVQNITPALNAYATNPSYIYWAGVNGASNYENRSQCSSFITLLLKQSYGWDNTKFKNWLGSTSPSAVIYHDAIQAGNGFTPKAHVQDIAVGDIIAIDYPSGLTSTGHIMLVRTAPQAMATKAPVIAGTDQYAVEVYDSSQSGHGATDTRKLPDGTWNDGAGFGIFRIYADSSTNEIVGYTWSTYTNSIYYSQSDRHLVVGTLQLP